MKKKTTFVCSIISSSLYFVCLFANFINIFMFKALINMEEPIGPGIYSVFNDVNQVFVKLLSFCKIFFILIIIGMVFSVLSLLISKNIEKYKQNIWIIVINFGIQICFCIFNIVIFAIYQYLIFSVFVITSFVVLAICEIVDLANNKRHLRKYYYQKSIQDQGLIVDLLNNNNNQNEDNSSSYEFDKLFLAAKNKKEKYDKYTKMLEANIITKKEYNALIEDLSKDDENK